MTAVDVFRAIADPHRRRILDLLRERERTVSELHRHFAVSQPALSQHLRVLRQAGLVRQRPEGRHRVYRLDPVQLAKVYDWVAHYEEFWSERLVALRRYLDETDPEGESG